ncbi:MAG: hypothetical protein ACRDTA_23290 [Pseudonocardiaceae bacterium]
MEAAVVAWVQEGEELATRFAALETEIALMQTRPSLDEAGERGPAPALR